MADEGQVAPAARSRAPRLKKALDRAKLVVVKVRMPEAPRDRFQKLADEDERDLGNYIVRELQGKNRTTAPAEKDT